jgi:alpha-1,3-rhamnosyl/mannosyltransferase
VVYEGVAPTFRVLSGAETEPVLAQYGLRAGAYLLALGTLQPRKNLLTLLRAVRLLLDDGCDPGLVVLVGATGWGSTLEAEVERLGLTPRVRILGYLPNEALPAIYSGARAFAFPSLYEGFGLPVLEAMACGTPVVASNCSSLPEVVGEAGLLADPRRPAAFAGALRRLLAEPDLAARLREAGLARAAEFTWERCARETARILEEAGRD